MTGTHSNTFGGSLTMQDLKDAITKLKATPKNDQWLLISPTGEAYKGTVKQILPLLMKHHPLCQQVPYAPPDFEWEDER